jgi:Xaa-Pro aminopeptidase
MARASLFTAVMVASVLLQWPVRAQIPPEGGTAAYVADLTARRARMLSALDSDTVFVLWSAPSRPYSADIDYPYRQDSTLFYFTGLTAEATKLVLMPGSAAREFAFVRQSDPFRELWRGHDLTPAEVTASTGIQAVVAAPDDRAFQSFIDAVLTGREPPLSTSGAASSAPAAGSVQTRRRRLAIVEPLPADFEATPAPGEGGSIVRWARAMRVRYPAVEVVSVAPLVQRQRQVKTPYEQRILTRSAAISAAAHVEGMRVTRPGRWEYELKAVVEYQFLKSGALSWGYPSIVGSGPNATSLHYLSGTRQMRDGEMVLVDAAGSYQGLTADITRSYPVNGRFTPAQRAIYELVLKAQEAGIAAARPGVGADAVTHAIRGVFRVGLRELGLVHAAAGAELDAEVDLWFPHLPIHGIGVDVHDPLGDLAPGAAFVIEPGLYIRSDAFARPRPVPLPQALASQLAPAVARYRDIGIRIEDSFIMTATGPVMISADAPRRIADLERTVGKGR